MAGEIYQGKFFMHVLERSILRKSKRLMTSLQFVIRPLDSHLPKKIISISFNESPLKMMKNTFYFILKALSFSRYLNFGVDILVMQKQRPN